MIYEQWHLRSLTGGTIRSCLIGVPSAYARLAFSYKIRHHCRHAAMKLESPCMISTYYADLEARQEFET